MKTLTRTTLVAAALAMTLSTLGTATAGDDKPPMPQTRGMQGMDPKVHDRPAADPYKDCKPNPEKAAQQAKHPMPQTKGMQGMDPRMHQMDCPEPQVAKPDPGRHVHKGPGG